MRGQKSHREEYAYSSMHAVSMKSGFDKAVPGACFSIVPKLAGFISEDIILVG